MKRLDQNKHSKWFDAGTWFCTAALIGVLLTICSLIQSHGENFPKIFYRDTADTGMDFFHSIEYTKGRAPYELFGTLYPPLANLCFFFLLRMVPEWQYSNWADTFSGGISMRRSEFDLRVYQPTMMLFILFLLITAALLIMLIQRCFADMESGKRNLIAFSSLLTYGVLYGYERGNIVIISMMGVLFFLLYYDCDNRILSEMALLALAVAAGLKVYPAIFGVVLIYNKQYKKAARAIIYGIAFFVLPIFAFREGLSGFKVFLNILSSRATAPSFSLSGYGFDKLINVIVYAWCTIWGIPVNEEFLLAVIPKFNIIVACFFLLCGFLLKKRWQQALVSCVAMLLYNEQGTYATMFFLAPLMLLIAEEKQINLSNIVPFLAMTFFVILLPIMDSEDAILSYKELRFQICHVILALYLLAQTGTNLVKAIKSRGKYQTKAH